MDAEEALAGLPEEETRTQSPVLYKANDCARMELERLSGDLEPNYGYLAFEDLQELLEMAQSHEAALEWLRRFGDWHAPGTVLLGNYGLPTRLIEGYVDPSHWWAEVGQIRRGLWLVRFLKLAASRREEYEERIEEACLKRVVLASSCPTEPPFPETEYMGVRWPRTHSEGWLSLPPRIHMPVGRSPHEYRCPTGLGSEGVTAEVYLWSCLAHLVTHGLSRFSRPRVALQYEATRGEIVEKLQGAGSLGSAAWDILRRKAASLSHPRYCLHCGTLILNARRSTKKHCSGSCKTLYNRKRKKG